MDEEDLMLAFFPCTMFQENNKLWFKGLCSQQKNMSDKRKLEILIDRHDSLNLMYKRLSMLVHIALDRGLRLIVENPATQPHYLNMWWCIEPTIIDKDRSLRGDWFKKPTQYWFINCEPEQNFIFEPIEETRAKVIEKIKGKDKQVERSMIHPQYANRFIREFILDEDTL